MTMFIIQSALLLAVAIIIGCVIGYVLRMLIAPASTPAANGADTQIVRTGGKIASVPPADALTGAPIPPPTRILEDTKQVKDDDGNGQVNATTRTDGRKARKPATRKPAAKGASTKKTAATGAARKKPATTGGSAAAADAGKPKAIAKPAKPDDLTQISGIGPKIAGKLNGLGIYRWSQIGDWKKVERDWVNAHLSFKGRIEREDWIKQAKALARGKSGK